MISLFSDYDHGLNNFCQEEQEDKLREEEKDVYLKKKKELKAFLTNTICVTSIFMKMSAAEPWGGGSLAGFQTQSI